MTFIWPRFLPGTKDGLVPPRLEFLVGEWAVQAGFDVDWTRQYHFAALVNWSSVKALWLGPLYLLVWT